MFKKHDLTQTRMATHTPGDLKENGLMNKYIANLIGHTARQFISNPEFKGKVLAVFSNTIYLASETNEVIWLSTQEGFIHSRSIYLPISLPELYANTPFFSLDQSLEFEYDQFVLIDHAKTWEHQSIKTQLISPISSLKLNYQQLFNKILQISTQKGFGLFLPYINRIIEDKTNKVIFDSDDPILRTAWRTVADLIDACLNFNIKKILDLGEKLIGLGAGLTPSGDDFLGGLFFTLDQLIKFYPIHFQNDFYPVSEFIKKVYKQTNLISYTLLKDLSSGNAVEPLHQFMDALLTGQPVENMVFYLNRFIQIGYSTGWDEISGVLCGLLVTLNY